MSTQVPGQPIVRKRLEIANVPGEPNATNPPTAVQVVDRKLGPLSIFDKVKTYYHTVITLIGFVLVLLNQLLPAVGWIPGYGSQAAGYVSAAIVFVTAVANFLKSNEHWVDDL